MMSMLPDLLMWDQAASVNLSCGVGRMECDILRDLGPPPDMILNLPPPPVPPHLEELVSRMSAEALSIGEGVGGFPSSSMFGSQSSAFMSAADQPPSCDLCQWATGNSIGFVELAQKGPVIDDTWFLVIISSCVAATLVGIVMAIACLKYRDGKMKPLSDVALAKKEKALGLERCEAVLYPGPPTMAPPMPTNESHLNSRALWAGLKPLDEKFYTVDHCQPVSQKQARMDMIQNLEDKYDYKHYSPINYSTLAYSAVASESKGSPVKQGTFENVGFIVGDENSDQTLGRNNCRVSRAAYLLGGGTGRSTISRHPSHYHQSQQQQQQQQHHYEMVAPRGSPSGMRRNMTVDRNGRTGQPTISAPTNVVTAVRLPPLNSRPGRYALTALANGKHTLTRNPTEEGHEVIRRSQVALDRSGSTLTTLAPQSPTDHVYSSPITSPVI